MFPNAHTAQVMKARIGVPKEILGQVRTLDEDPRGRADSRSAA